MSHFLDEAAAQTAGYSFAFDEAGSRYTVSVQEPLSLVGFVSFHTQALSPAGPTSGVRVTTFLSTQVHPEHRGTGLAALLVDRAVRERVALGERIESRCWYVTQRLQEHPELLAQVA